MMSPAKLEKVIFCSQAVAETIGPWKDWALISISDPCSNRRRIKTGWGALLSLEFVDVDPVRFKDPHADALSEFVFTEEHARMTVDFVREVAPYVSGIVVHCHAGVSRSAAVAKWIAGEYRIAFDGKYDKYNQHV